MKKIYAFLNAYAFFGLFSFSVLAGNVAIGQGPSTSTCPHPIAQNFNPPSNPPGSTAGFTGNFIYGSVTTGGTTNGYLEHDRVVAGSSYTLTSPTYKLPNNATFIALGFFLDGTETVGTIEVRISYYSSESNNIETHRWAAFTPAYSGGSVSYQFCDQIFTGSLPGFLPGGSYRIQIDFTPVTGAGNIGQTITVDNFATNGATAAAPLPVTFTGFEAKKVANNVILNWKVAGEENVSRYDVERSYDGRNFETISSVTKTGQDSYTYTDANSNSTAYYRIKNVDNDNKFKYSTIIRIVNGRSDIVLRAFPQPVQSQLTLQHPTVSGRTLLSISTADGRVVRSLTLADGSMQTTVDLSGLQAGMYMLRYDGGDGNIQTLKVVKQ
jgi:hypothetical protein